MKSSTKLTFIAIGCLVILTLWQLPHFVMIWREYNSFQYGEAPYEIIQKNKPIIISDLAKLDPEAALVTEYYNFLEEISIDDLCQLSQEYPNNDFFLFLLIREFLQADSLNPEAALLLTNKLIANNPDNAHYHYLKALVIVNLQDQEKMSEVLEEIKIGNNAPQFEFTYNKYRERILNLYEASEISLLQKWVYSSSFDDILIYRSLASYLVHYCKDAYAKRDEGLALQAIDMGHKMGERIIENAIKPIDIFIGSQIIRGLKQVQLAHTDYSDKKDEEIHYELCRINRMNLLVEDTLIQYYKKGEELVLQFSFLSIVFYLLLIFFVLYLLVLISSIRQVKTIGYKAKYWSHILFFLYVVYYLLFPIVLHETENISKLLIILPMVIWFGYWAIRSLLSIKKKDFLLSKRSRILLCSVVWMSLVISVIGIYDIIWQILIFLLFATVIGFILWLLLTYSIPILTILTHERWKRNRFIQILLVATIFVGLHMVFNDYWIIVIINFLAIAVGSLLIIRGEIQFPFKQYVRLFSFSRGNSLLSITRNKLRILLLPYVLILWFSLLFLSQYISISIHNIQPMLKDPLTSIKPLPEINQEGYDYILDNIRSFETGWYSLFNDISLVLPRDLPPLLSQYKEKYSDSYHTGEWDSDILGRIKDCSSASRSILLDTLNNPNSEKALIVKAELGNITVKGRLINLLNDKLNLFVENEKANVSSISMHTDGCYTSRESMSEAYLDDIFTMASALAVISEPKKTITRYKHIIEQVTSLRGDKGWYSSESLSFYESLENLPPQLGTEIITFYLNQTQYKDFQKRDNLILYVLGNTIFRFGNCELAEKVFMIMLETDLIEDPPTYEVCGLSPKEEESFYSPEDMAPHFRHAIVSYLTEESIPVIERGLANSNPDIRAYSVWVLSRLDYEWGQKGIQLLDDESWKVRFNSLFIKGNAELIEKARNDENSVVKFMDNWL